jgi:hypothetical protein
MVQDRLGGIGRIGGEPRFFLGKGRLSGKDYLSKMTIKLNLHEQEPGAVDYERVSRF